MADNNNPQFSTHRRSISTNNEYKWGSDTGENWTNAVDSEQNITVTQSGVTPSVFSSSNTSAPSDVSQVHSSMDGSGTETDPYLIN